MVVQGLCRDRAREQTRLINTECLGSPFEQTLWVPWHQQFHLMHFLLVFPKTPIPIPNNHGAPLHQFLLDLIPTKG